jgi:hypothetical protein
VNSSVAGEDAARARALAVLRVRSAALALAVLPAAVAVLLPAARLTGHAGGPGWTALCWTAGGVALAVLAVAAGVAAVIARAAPAVSPTVTVSEEIAPELYRMVRELAGRLDVPAPSAIALTPDCDSWLEDRSHLAARAAAPAAPARAAAPARPEGEHGEDGQDGAGDGGDGAGPSRTAGSSPAGAPEAGSRAGSAGGDRVPGASGAAGRRGRRSAQAPVLVIGSPFMWWMRVAELRALLAPVVAGTGPFADPDIAAARRFVRGLDAAVAVCAQRAARPGPARMLRGPAFGLAGAIARLMLRSCRAHVAEMERAVAAAASESAQAVDYGLRIVAQEQVGLAYAGWDRLLTRVALPAWRMGRWPSRLDAGVVAALTELSRRDRLAEGFETRLGERPACDLLEAPGTVDEAASLLAARLFHGGPARSGPDWSPVSWEAYPQEVVDRIWRTDAARLHRVLDELSPPSAPEARSGEATLARVLDRLAQGGSDELAARIGAHQQREERRRERAHAESARAQSARAAQAGLTDPAAGPDPAGPDPAGPDPTAGGHPEAVRDAVPDAGHAIAPGAPGDAPLDVIGPEGEPPTPVYQLLPPRTGRELLADHVTAMVCCAAVDTAGATPGLDWLDGPALLVGGVRRSDLATPVLRLVEHGDPAPLRAWLAAVGVRLEMPVRLV